MTRDPRSPSAAVVAVGAVAVAGRGSLPYALIHGESLVACAAWALEEAEVELVDPDLPWTEQQVPDAAFVLHDALCPMTPPAFLADCLRALPPGGVVAGVRPVTDTVKLVRDGLVGRTVDRAGLLAVTSPVVLSAGVCAALPGLPTSDFADLVTDLRRDFPTVLLPAPPDGRRVATADDVRLLQALTTPTRG